MTVLCHNRLFADPFLTQSNYFRQMAVMITDEVFAMPYRISDKWNQLWDAAQQDLHIRKCIAKPQNISYRKQRTARFMRCV